MVTSTASLFVGQGAGWEGLLNSVQPEGTMGRSVQIEERVRKPDLCRDRNSDALRLLNSTARMDSVDSVALASVVRCRSISCVCCSLHAVVS